MQLVRRFCAVTAAIALVPTGMAHAAAWGEAVLYSFTGQPDGSNPQQSNLILDATGSLYGTTLQGGAANFGTVFKLTPPAKGKTSWTEILLHSFTGHPDGMYPGAGVVFDKSGNLYGTTSTGGRGLGTVYKMTPPAKGEEGWTETVLYSFTGQLDGGNPSGVVLDSAGNLYGTTGSGGITTTGCTTGCGTVFTLTPPVAEQTAWTETPLYAFAPVVFVVPDGIYPGAGVTFDAAGNLYGTTSGGGFNICTGGCGTVFKLERPAKGEAAWTETVLYHFGGHPDGAYPVAGVTFDATNRLYATTKEGGEFGFGAVLRLNKPAKGKALWTDTVLHSFHTGTADGGYPVASVIFDAAGNLYGTTSMGRIGGDGTVFKLTRSAKVKAPWVETVLHNFSGDMPSETSGVIFDASGSLYGTIGPGGGSFGDVFVLKP